MHKEWHTYYNEGGWYFRQSVRGLFKSARKNRSWRKLKSFLLWWWWSLQWWYFIGIVSSFNNGLFLSRSHECLVTMEPVTCYCDWKNINMCNSACYICYVTYNMYKCTYMFSSQHREIPVVGTMFNFPEIVFFDSWVFASKSIGNWPHSQWPWKNLFPLHLLIVTKNNLLKVCFMQMVHVHSF